MSGKNTFQENMTAENAVPANAFAENGDDATAAQMPVHRVSGDHPSVAVAPSVAAPVGAHKRSHDLHSL